MSRIILREQEWKELKDDLKNHIWFCIKQEAINNEVKAIKEDVDFIKDDYVSKTSIWKWVAGSLVVLTLLGMLGFKTAFLEGYSVTNESNRELSQAQQNIIEEKQRAIERLELKLDSIK